MYSGIGEIIIIIERQHSLIKMRFPKEQLNACNHPN
jgi:hypothetical protein